MEKGEPSSQNINKSDRKTIEKNRRLMFKSLCMKLVSLIPHHHFSQPKEFLSQNDQLEQAASYVTILRNRIDELRRRKTQLMMRSNANNNNITGAYNNLQHLPILEIKEFGSDLEVVLISGIHKRFKLHQVLSIIEQEGAQLVAVNVATIGNQIYHTIHAQVKVARVGVDTSVISERIHDLIAQSNIIYIPVVFS